MENQLETCKNCEQQFEEGFKFCPHCGQQAKEELTVKVLFYNTISNYFSFDARFFKSFFPLLLKPGYLARRFVEGKRLLYLHPAQMYLFITVVFFFLFSFIQRKQVQSLDETLAKTLKQEKALDTIKDSRIKDSIYAVKLSKKKKEDSIARANVRKTLENNKIFHGFSDNQIDSIVKSDNFKKNDGLNFDFNEASVDSLIASGASDQEIYKQMGMSDDAGSFTRRLYAQALKFYKSRQGGSILQAFYDTIPIAMFFLLPIFALILKIFYWRRGLYAHHLVFSFYYFSFLFTVFSIIIGVNFIIDIPDWIDFLIALSTFVYLFLALKRFYQQGWFFSFFKASVVSFFFLSFVAPLAVLILGMFAFLFY
ncbi:DUF3667 domain-containing protein [Sabulilitoribacter multivorans]|uniref:DUF3667 domain-containing protein n=1 Tax=Flaviramulus multivorans TaxID=1304750 RepID=A0ABS9IJP0_9FLAO|nr:DUF3667 domain-containing protein [Flaviramulus multivorans]MCF7560826.1 DUF3667 domain-containing protein [Flaviramulus multivorans]